MGTLLSLLRKLCTTIVIQILSFVIIVTGVGITYATWNILTTSQGASGQPVTQTLMQGIIDNINDLNTRLAVFSINSGNVGIGTGATTNATLTVSGTIIASTPTATGQLATKGYVDAAVVSGAGGGYMQGQYYGSACVFQTAGYGAANGYVLYYSGGFAYQNTNRTTSIVYPLTSCNSINATATCATGFIPEVEYSSYDSSGYYATIVRCMKT